MNILPKKSWHVRNKDNIARVQRDEENAAKEEQERQRRIALAESEARTQLLRDRARDRSKDDLALDVTPSTSQSQHINFFEELEEGKKQKKGNVELEKEKREEKEKQEKAIGLLTYLGQSEVEAQGSKPWYLSKRDEQEALSPNNDVRNKVQEEFDRKKKQTMDPLATMMKYLDKQKKHKEHEGKHSHRHHEHKHKKHKKHADKSKPAESTKKTMAQLRAERLRREQEERHRAERLLAKARGEKLPEEKVAEPMDERDRSYNSQFNPELARKRKRRDIDEPYC